MHVIASKKDSMSQSQQHALFVALLLVMAGIETNPGPLTHTSGNWVHVTAVGHYHQGVTSQFSAYSVGKQCLPNSVTAITCSHLSDISQWTSYDMDKILDSGDELYKRLDPDHDLLEFADIPCEITIFAQKWQVKQKGEIHGNIDQVSIQKCLEQSFGEGDDCVAMLGTQTGASALAIMKRGNKIYMFDPHSRSHDTALPAADGTSVLVQFSVSKDLACYLSHLALETKSTQISMCVLSCLPKSTCESEQSQHKCELCNKICSCAANLKKYLQACQEKQTADSKDKTLQCSHCGRVLHNAYNLQTHDLRCKQMSQKLQAQVYACQYCDHILHNAFNLKEHEQRCKEKGKTMKQEAFLCPHCQRICDNA